MPLTLGRNSYAIEVADPFSTPVQVGKFTSIAAKLTVVGNTGNHPQTVSTYPFAEIWKVNHPPCRSRGPTVIGSDVWIGANVLLLDGVTIGDGAIVGAGAVVARDIPPYAVAVGNPARPVRFRFTAQQIESLLRIRWWDWTEDRIREALPLFQDIERFLATYDDRRISDQAIQDWQEGG